jgi:nucleoside-diphosphate-sugar epimerase
LGDIIQLEDKMEVISLRIASTYGVGERAENVLIKFVEQAKENEKLTVWGEGNHAPDFIYVEDVINALERTIYSDAPPGIYNIGSGQHWSIEELARSVNEVFDNRGNLTFDKNRTETEYQYYMDCSRAATALGWTPSYSLLEGLNEMADRY